VDIFKGLNLYLLNLPSWPCRSSLHFFLIHLNSFCFEIATNKKILTVLEETKAQVTQNTKLLQMLLLKLDLKEKNASVCSGELPEGIVLPISSPEHFEMVEQRLNKTETLKQLVSFFFHKNLYRVLPWSVYLQHHVQWQKMIHVYYM